MLLKELQIRGFKSFLNNTILKFPKGITAIVGPNGSGKSNISDAIRWVLGESSIKNLRGNKMEDVIFTGTENYKPVSFCEVSITFAECKINELPYDEVVVTRRMFRDGMSEFYINKNKVRLRDVRELFMDTGIGRDGYSLIGQGQIDSILSNKPEDRRYIFEEASGISKYKYRKEEALRKIERSNEDLDRLSDIFSEINSQYTYLEDESKKTERYNEIIIEKNEINKDLLHFNILKNKNEEEGILNENKISEEELEKLSIEINDLTKEKKLEEEQLDKINSELEEYNNKKLESTRKFGEVKTDYRLLEERKNRIVDEIGILSKNIENNVLEKEAIILRLQQYNSDLNSFNPADQNEINELDELRLEISNIEKEIEDKRNQSINYNLKRQALLKEMELQNTKKIFYTNEFEKVNAEIKSLEDNLDRIKIELDSDKIKLIKAEEEKNSIIKEHNASLEEFNQTKSKYDQLAERYNNLNEEFSRIELSINFNKNILSSNELLFSPIKYLEKEYSIEDGYYGTVVSKMEVQSKFVKAIETAMGSKLQFIFCKDANTAKSMVDSLNKTKSGRATFLPLDRSTKIVPQKRNYPQGILGHAIDFIKAEEPYYEIIMGLLGEIVIAEDLKIAIKYQKDFRQIVTLNGEVVNNSGSITGGKYQREKETPLTIKSRLKDLNDKKINLENSIHDIDKKKEKLNEDILKKADLLDKIKLKISSLDSEIQDLSNNVNAVNNNLFSLNNDINNKKAKSSELELTLEEIIIPEIVEEEIEDLNPLYDLLESKKSIYNELDLKNREMLDRNLNIEKIKLYIKNENEKLVDLENKNSEAIKEMEQKKIDKDKIEIELKEIFNKLADIESLEHRDDDAIISIQNNRQQVKLSIDGINIKISNINSDIRNIENRINLNKIKLARIEENRNNIIVELENLSLNYEEFIKEPRDNKNILKKRERLRSLDSEIESLGNVNLNAINEFKDIVERKSFYQRQISDIERSISDLNSVIAEVNREMKVQFRENFVKIQENFERVFKRLFNGGDARVSLVNESDPLNSGISIVARPPGKKLQSLSLLSGGEKTLTAMALLFAILELKPSPFCILDEIDAALDDANIVRYTKFLKELSKNSQFLIITHRKTTLYVAETIYGVHMKEKGISEIISMRFEDYKEE
ncbi:MAG: chromosome segregation protein SMC [Ezakiella sp.]|nr:chromosome segregation protein SMC [Ezakiella sp.]